MIGNRIQSAFLTEHNYPLAASLSLSLMFVVVVMVVAYVGGPARRTWSDGRHLSPQRVAAEPRPPDRRTSPTRWLADRLVLFIGILVLIYTFVPIGYIIALSFNQPTGRSATAQFEAFTWSNWTTVCEPTGCASRSG